MKPEDFALGQPVEVHVIESMGLKIAGPSRGIVVGHSPGGVIVRFEEPTHSAQAVYGVRDLTPIGPVELLAELDRPGRESLSWDQPRNGASGVRGVSNVSVKDVGDSRGND